MVKAANRYFRYLALVLPCTHCRASYSEFINEGLVLEDGRDVVDARQTRLPLSTDFRTRNFWSWSVAVHNRVNHKLGLPLLDFSQAPPPLPWESVEVLVALFKFAAFAFTEVRPTDTLTLTRFMPDTLELLYLMNHRVIALLYRPQHTDALRTLRVFKLPCTQNAKCLPQRLDYLCHFVYALNSVQQEFEMPWDLPKQLGECRAAHVKSCKIKRGQPIPKGC